ncbi:hypothetical protein [Photobacterium leiognathi]|uniref:hypothetical protein n=1 Tax=Photobacterium leiognathi TaxID=553611 RepID=UPI002980BDEF|nr:hypothetical protein [Photobacterium leiognathi]
MFTTVLPPILIFAFNALIPNLNLLLCGFISVVVATFVLWLVPNQTELVDENVGS